MDRRRSKDADHNQPDEIREESERIKCLRRGRTYTRDQLEARIPGCDNEFISHLTKFFGLLPMGRSQYIYDGDNVIDALARYSSGEVVPCRRNPLTRAQIREMEKELQE